MNTSDTALCKRAFTSTPDARTPISGARTPDVRTPAPDIRAPGMRTSISDTWMSDARTSISGARTPDVRTPAPDARAAALSPIPMSSGFLIGYFPASRNFLRVTKFHTITTAVAKILVMR